ncbi:MAG: hypothetical protein H7242_03750 [Microbacteriaceae bacterium]|nr:hypothetical protein [Burkholderiaceae bacterium]
MNFPLRRITLASGRLAALHRAGLRRIGWALLLLVSACQAQPVAPADEAALLAKLRTEIGDARCNSDAQCRSLAIGHKACGGPQQWWAWSTTTARLERLQPWADELAVLQKQRQEASSMVSNCLYVADPGAVCQAQRCVPRTSAAAANAR